MEGETTRECEHIFPDREEDISFTLSGKIVQSFL
jgi:hypothetical protein